MPYDSDDVQTRFDRALTRTLQHEGGWANHKADTPTMRGVTQATYDAHRRRLGREIRSVRYITEGEFRAIYRGGYWDPIKGDDLPDGVAFAVFDAGVMSGPGRAVEWMQDALGVKVDGIVGPLTLDAAHAADPVALIRAICDRRLAFCKSLSKWAHFGGGWTARIKAVEMQATAWAAGSDVPEFAPVVVPLPKARGEVTAAAAAKKHAPQIAAYAAAAAAGGDLRGKVSGLDGPLAWGLAGALVIGAAAWAVTMVRRTESAAAA